MTSSNSEGGDARPSAIARRSGSGQGGARVRDSRLDFWRGLCLVDMVLGHLAWEGVDFGVRRGPLTESFRFAAGGYVFVAGVGVALVWLHRMDGAAARAHVRGALW